MDNINNCIASPSRFFIDTTLIQFFRVINQDNILESNPTYTFELFRYIIFIYNTIMTNAEQDLSELNTNYIRNSEIESTKTEIKENITNNTINPGEYQLQFHKDTLIASTIFLVIIAMIVSQFTSNATTGILSGIVASSIGTLIVDYFRYN